MDIISSKSTIFGDGNNHGGDNKYFSNFEKADDGDKYDCVSVLTKKYHRYNSLRHYFKLSVTYKVLLTILFGFIFLNENNYCSAGFACLSNPCVFGVCIDDLNSTYSCYCIDGYTGIQCQTNWDECWSSPCGNGGTCIDGVAQYNCTCHDGFVGQNCEVNLDECLSNPCQNGGICNDENNGYVCNCMPGFVGTHCETDIAVCEEGNERCFNGGECVEGPGLAFLCKCPMGWQGALCDVEIDDCESAPCQNGGVCIDKLASYQCACLMGYSGSNCEEQILVCEDSPCQNNALCLMEEGMPVCYCVPDFHGEKCEYQYDECQLGPRCLHGGNCIDGVDEFSCSCTPHFSGIFCECLILASGDLDCNISSATTGFWATFQTPQAQGSTAQSTNRFTNIFSYSRPTPYSDFTRDFVPTSRTFSYSDIDSDSLTSDILSGVALTDKTLPPITEPSTFSTNILTSAEDTLSTVDMTLHSVATHSTDEETPFSTSQVEEITTIPAPPKTTIDDSSTDDVFVSPQIAMTTINEAGTTVIDAEPPTTDATISAELTTEILAIESSEITASAEEVNAQITSTADKPDVTTNGEKQEEESETTTIEAEKEEETTTEKAMPTDEEETPISGIESDTTKTDEDVTETVAVDTETSAAITETVAGSTETEAVTETEAILVTETVAEASLTESDISPKTFTTTESTEYAPITVQLPTTIDMTAFSEKLSTTTEKPRNITSFTNCFKMPCRNGGTCVSTSEGAKCVCNFDHQGSTCETPITIRNAAFNGDSYLSHQLYSEQPQFKEPDLETILPIKIELKGRTKATDGLILLASAQAAVGGYYMALFLRNGLLQFQFSCGLQTMLLSELEAPVNNGNEILIQAELDFNRNLTHCNSSLLINNTLAMSGDQPTWLQQVYLRRKPAHRLSKSIHNIWLHIGGAPQAPVGLFNDIPMGQGFTGCLHSLKINGIPRELFSDALDGFGITECGSLACLSNPCSNGGICIEDETNETYDDDDDADGNYVGNGLVQKYTTRYYKPFNDKWKCKCPTGYSGANCETSICESNNPCQHGGTCVVFPSSGYLCLCPLGKHGHYCEHNIEILQPSFSGSINGLSSYVVYPVPIPLQHSMELSMKIIPTTLSQISLLAFFGQSSFHDEKSDHFAVSFVQGYIMVTWNLGGGARRIFTQKPLLFKESGNLQQSFTIQVGRTGRSTWLAIDKGKFNVSGHSPGTTYETLDVVPMLYLGGHSSINFTTLPHDLPRHSGFQGCIYDVKLKAGAVTVPLQQTRGVKGRSVGQCGTRECHRYACQNNGACLQHGATKICICQDGWYGPICSQSYNPCDAMSNQCHASSQCVPLVSSYECDCSIGKTGKNCDQNINFLSDVSLSGRRSFLSIDWPQEAEAQALTDVGDVSVTTAVPCNDSSNQMFAMPPHSAQIGGKNFFFDRVQHFSIEFQIRPLSERGVLIFSGSHENNLGTYQGYICLSLQGGVVEFRLSNLNDQVSVVRSNRVLAIGEWHKLKISQSGRRLVLWVEGSSSTATTSTSESFLDFSTSKIFIGGIPDLSLLPHNSLSGFPVPFRGCVRKFTINGRRIVLDENSIREARNVADCDGTACGEDSCQLGTCWLDDKLQPHCKCPEYARGDRCEITESCRVIRCKNGGKCLRNGQCSCLNGWGGYYCEIATNKFATPSFKGNSYLIISPSRTPSKDKRNGPVYLQQNEQVNVMLNFSTISPDGLLFWQQTADHQYIGVGLQNGHIKLTSDMIDFINETIDLPAGGFLSDGSWHTVHLEADTKNIELSIDGRTVFKENKKNNMENSAPNVVTAHSISQNIFYIGGFPESEHDTIKSRTNNKFSKSFSGCIQSIHFGNETSNRIDHFSEYQGENIGECELYDDFILG